MCLCICADDFHVTGYFPVMVPAEDPDNHSGDVFCNYTRVLYVYWAFYCYYEGLHTTHAEARRVLLYIFYAKPMFRRKPTPVINILHSCLQSGTYSFPQPEELFKDALTILRSNPDANEWLTDGGKNQVDGDPKYNQFLAAVEQGKTYISPDALIHMSSCSDSYVLMNCCIRPDELYYSEFL